MATPITQQIQSLLEPPVESTSEARVLEHLNTTFPSFDALNQPGALDNDALQTEERLRDLTAKLKESSEAVSKKISSTISSASTSLSSAKELSLTRHALADQLAGLTEELAPTTKGRQRTLLEELEDLHIRISELKLTRAYVGVIEKALALSEDAIAQVRSSPGGAVSQACLTVYIQLQELVDSVTATVKPATVPDSSEPLKLVTFLATIRERTWKDIVSVLSENLATAAERLRWPSPIAPDTYRKADVEEKAAFESNFINLLRLQAAGESIHDDRDQKSLSPEKLRSAVRRQGLYPLQSLLEPITLRFRYHFDGKRQTNRPDKPEWYLTHVLNLMHEHRPFMTEIVQDLLQKGGYGNVNAYDEFCRLLFNLPARKLKRTVPLVLDTPAILAHTVYQTLVFDGTVRDGGFDIRRTWEGRERLRLASQGTKSSSYKRNSRSGTKDAVSDPLAVEWEGISDIILANKEWFDAWLGGERRFADNQYNDIISSPDAWLISDDAGDDADPEDLRSGDRASRVTTSARRFKALIERVTERYQPLPSLLQRSHFLFDIQLPLFEAYLSRITSSLDAYERLSSSFVRAVPGALAGKVGHGTETKRLTSGVEGLGRIVKALVSARWVKSAMEGWGEELLFLELWQGIQEQPVLRARADGHAMLPPSQPPQSLTAGEADSTLFDVLIKSYGELVARAEDMILKQVCAEVETDLKAYFASQWQKPDAEEESDLANAMSLPATLVGPIALLSSEVSFLAQSLPAPTVTSLYRKIATTISNHIVQRAVAHRGRNQFTSAQGRAFKEECATWVETSRLALSNGGTDPLLSRRVELPWQSLLDVAAIVGASDNMYTKTVVASYDGTDEQFATVMTELDVRGLRREDVKGLLRARVEFSR